MPDLSTTYMGLKLRNPVIVASSGLTKTIDNLLACERAGAGAIVLKSLFEEVLRKENFGLKDSLVDHAEAYDYYYAHLELLYGAKDYTNLVRKSKESLSIPVIASINCISAEWWPDFAKQLQSAGADAIELNVFTTATDLSMDAATLEELYFQILTSVKASVSIPVSLKIGPWFTALPKLAVDFGRRGIDGLVLFNRFTQPDIDIDTMTPKTTYTFSTNDEMLLPLRWIALMSHYLEYDLCGSTGIKSGGDAIKLLLAGASSVQVASVLYNEGIGHIGSMLEEIEQWMDAHDFQTTEQFKGRLNFHKSGDAGHYLRSQFMDKIGEVENER